MSIELSASPTLAGLLAPKAPLASPTFTGTPAAPTAAPGTDTTQLATTAFVKAAVDLAVTGLLDFKGSTDCSSNPNYPAASKGDAYIVSVAGKIGGASGKSVDIGDVYVASADNAGGTEASVGTSWFVLEHNLSGVQPLDTDLTAIAALTSAPDKALYATGAGTWALADFKADIRTLAAAASMGALRTAAGLEIGTNVQAYSAILAALASAAVAPPPAIPSGRWMLGEGTGQSATGTAPGADSIRMYPIRIRRPVTITDLNVRVTTLAASGNVQIAIYAADPATLAPTGAPVFSSSGFSTGSTGGVGPSSQSIALAAGVYWFATNCDTNAATAVFTARTTSPTVLIELVGASSAVGALTNAANLTGWTKTQTYNNWPTLTGNFTTDSLAQSTGVTIPLVAFVVS